MKTNLTIFALLLLVSCGKKESSSGRAPAPDGEIEIEQPVSVVNRWINDDQDSDFKELDLSNMVIDGKQASILECNGLLASNDKVQGISPEQMRVDGTESSGSIQFGNLSYVQADNTDCMVASGNKFTYEIVGSSLLVDKPNGELMVFQLAE